MSNKIYYIYEIEGVKVGCTVNIENRMQEQGYSNPIILEEHTDIYLASDREIELQKEKGYPVDKIPYWQAVLNRVPSKEVMARGGKTQGDINAANGHMNRIKTKESCAKGGRKTGRLKRALTFEQAEEIRFKFKQLESEISTKIGRVRVLSSEYNVSTNVIEGIVYNFRYLTP